MNKNLNKQCKFAYNVIDKFFNTPYNFSLLILTVLFWYLISFTSYSSAGNFHMHSYFFTYVQITSCLSIIIGFLSNKESLACLSKLGVITLLLSLFTTILARIIPTNFVLTGLVFTNIIFYPLTIFFFTLLFKEIWNAASEQLDTK